MRVARAQRRPASAALGALATLLALAPCASARATTPPLGERWRWFRYGAESGLPSERVVDVVEAHGVTWAATATGLARFDGWEWHAVPEGAGLAASFATPLLDADGGLVAIQDGRLYRHERGGFALVPLVLDGRPYSVLSGAAVTHPHHGRGLLLLGRFTGRPGRMLAFLGTRGLEPLDPPDAIDHGSRVVSTRAGAWLEAESGLRRLGATGFDFALPAARCCLGVLPVVENSDGAGAAAVLFPPEQRGIWTWSAGGMPARDEAASGARVAALDVSPDGDVLVVFQTGEALVRRRGQWSAVPLAVDLAGLLAFRFTADGDAWACTERGLFLFRGSSARWSHWKEEGPDPANVVHDLVRTRDGSILVATAGGLQVRRPDGTVSWHRHAGDQPLLDVTGVAEDERGGIFVVSGNAFTGAYRWDGATWRHFGAAEGFAAGYVHRIASDQRGRLWFLSLTHGADQAEDHGAGAFTWHEGRFERFGDEQGLPRQRLYAFAEGASGDLWFGHGDGLSRLRSGRWTHWRRATGLRAQRVYAVALDSSDRAWFADHVSGLGMVEDDDGVRYVTTSEGLVGDGVWDAEEGADGRLWVATQAGLSCRIGDRWTTYDAGAGLAQIRVATLLVGPEAVHVGTVGGGVAILSLAADAGARPPKVVASVSVTHDPGAPAAVASWRTLPWRGEAPPEDLATRWRLDDGPWSSWSRDREVAFDALDRGTHVLAVEALGLSGAGSSRSLVAFGAGELTWRHPAFLVPLATLLLATTLLSASLVIRRARHVAELRRSEERYRGLFEDATDLICTVGLDGRVRSVNVAGERAMGRPRAELIGRTLNEVVAPDHAARALDLLSRAHAEGGPVVAELDLAGRGGARQPIELSGRRVHEPHGGGDGIQLIGRDVSERRAAEAERLRVERQLLEVQKLESLGVLAGGIAHDFNNLLLAILGNAEIATEMIPRDSAAREHVQRIVAAAGRAADLTQQLLAFAGKARVVAEPVDLDAFVREMVDLLRVSLPKDAALVLDLAARRTVAADTSHLQQVLMNLIVNAGEALLDGSGTVTLRTRDEGDMVRIEVSDTGRGIAPDVLPRIFDPFFTTKFAGRGLGLPAVQGAVRGHGGSVHATSVLGEGTTFTVLLPAAPASATLPERAGVPEDFRGEGLVLIVDDEDRVRQVVAAALAAMGFEVATAGSGQRAVEIFREDAARVRLVVLDLVMPGMGGDEVLEALRAIRPDVRVLLVSGYDESEARRRGGTRDPAPFLQKPFRVKALGEKIREVLGSA